MHTVAKLNFHIITDEFLSYPAFPISFSFAMFIFAI